jgi:hypothetical protein
MFFWSNSQFTTEDVPDLTGKLAIITGASSGVNT